MKRNFLPVLLFFIATHVHAQPVSEGYYITLANDTIQVMLKIPETPFSHVGTNRLYSKIKIVDSTGSFIKMTPSAIRGFGFTRKNKDYTFISKPVNHKRNKFFEVISSGNNARLYYYSFYATSGKVRSKKEMFIIEKPVETDLLVKHYLSRKKIKNTLKEFYSSSPESSRLIDSSSITLRHLKGDLKKIVDDINKL